MNVDPRALVGRLNHDTRSALEAAAGLCVSRTHYDVEVEHFLTKILEDTANDAAVILKHFEVDRSRLVRDLTESLDSLKTGNPRTPALSPKLVNLLSNAWLACSLEHREGQVRTGHTLLALVSDADLRRLATGISREFEKISAESLKEEFGGIIASSSEEAEADFDEGEPGAPRHPTKTPKLDQYTHNLTERAQKGEMDPVLGRDFEIRQVVDILTRRRQNNPILVGRPVSGRRPSWRDLRSVWWPGMFRKSSRTSRFVPWTWPCCRPEPASKVSSRTG